MAPVPDQAIISIKTPISFTHPSNPIMITVAEEDVALYLPVLKKVALLASNPSPNQLESCLAPPILSSPVAT